MADLRLRPEDDPPSLLVALFDADVASWRRASPAGAGADPSSAALEACAAVREAMSQLLVFLNTFLALHDENRVMVLVYGRDGSQVAYPQLAGAAGGGGDRADPPVQENDLFDASGGASADREQMLLDLRDGVTRAVARSLAAQARPANVERASLVSPSLAKALCLINRRRILKIERPGLPDDVRQSAMAASGAAPSAAASQMLSSSKKIAVGGQARILNVLASRDVPEQYVPVMNCIFSAQRLGVPIDTCFLRSEGDSTYFQQAAHLTGGVYFKPEDHRNELLQTLMTIFLIDSFSREVLSMPVMEEVDFRASCFATRAVIQEGYTCSVCLSTFDLSVGKRAYSCPTCHARFSRAVGNARSGAQKPALARTAGR